MLSKTVSDLIESSLDIGGVAVERTDSNFGHFSTNIALKQAKENDTNPRDLAKNYVEKLEKITAFAEVTVAGPGFINVTLADKLIIDDLNNKKLHHSTKYSDKIVVCEYSDPNPFKQLHIGHLYTTIIGDSISNLIAKGGGKVHKVNFGGDVGMHVAKAMYGIVNYLSENKSSLDKISGKERAAWLGERYVEGASAYENGKTIEIKKLNKQIYEIVGNKDKNSDLAKIYWTCRKWSYDYFKDFYKKLDTSFEKYYPESENAQLGLNIVNSHIGDVFQKSDGAVVFPGEKYGLHTRVFINNEGLPTYETKDVGLAFAKMKDYNFDTTVIITGNDILEYMKVVLKAIEQFEPRIADSTQHITHGQVKMAGGVKMSSRLGNVLSAEEVVDGIRKLVKTERPDSKVDSTSAAIKFAFLKQRTGPDVVFDPKESISLEGKSGPYLQYAHARAYNLIKKSGGSKASLDSLVDDEVEFALKITEYKDVLAESIQELAPHKIAGFAYELTQSFNRFYENNRVIGNVREATRLELVKKYSETLKDCLDILNIQAPESM